MKYKTIVALVCLFLIACTPNQNSVIQITTEDVSITIMPPSFTTDTAAPTKLLETKTPEHIFTSSPYPTSPFTYVPSVEYIERWQEFQVALAGKLISHVPSENAFCEWEVLGEMDTEIYVWVICKGYFIAGEVEKVELLAGADTPAVIYVNKNKAIEYIEIPKGGNLYSQSIREMFPDDIVERIITKQINYQRLADHLKYRMENSDEPPLIVLDSTKVP